MSVVNHSRVSYNLIDLLSFIGGVTNILRNIFGIILFTVSQYSFTMQAMRYLYVATTKKEFLFKRKGVKH